MDSFLIKLLYRKIKFKAVEVSVLDLLLIVCVSMVGKWLRKAVVTDTASYVYLLTDYVMAFLAAVYVYRKTKGSTRAVLTYALFLIWPIFTANSSILGKNGSFTGVLLILGLIMYDLGMKWISIPAYLAAGALAVLSFLPLERGTLLTAGWPNVYRLICDFMFAEYYEKVSVLFLLGLLLCVVYGMARKDMSVGAKAQLPMLAFLFVLIPFFLPYMPAYAGYGADVLLLLWAILEPKKCYLAFAHVLISYCAYADVLNGESKLPMSVYAAALFVILVLTGVFAYLKFDRKES